MPGNLRRLDTIVRVHALLAAMPGGIDPALAAVLAHPDGPGE